MFSIGHSAWHAGGTRAPSLMKRGGQRGRIRVRDATHVVPLRAIRHAATCAKYPVRSAFRANDDTCGTQWHDRPTESARDRRWAR